MTTWIADVLGHGITITTTHPRLEALARVAFPEGVLPPIAHLRFEVDQTRRGPVVLQGGVHRWLLWSGGAGGVVDCTRWSGRVVVGPGVVADPTACRYLVLEPACLFMATAYDRVPVHAAALVRDGQALLLAGPPGSGKSTLAWAASAAGLGVLAEDVVYVQSRPALSVRGLGRHVHLRPEVASRLHVPEIAVRTVRAGGVDKVAVAIASPPMRAARPCGIVMMVRGGAPALEPMAAAVAADRLARAVPGGFARFRRETAELAPRLAAVGAWQLAVSDAPEAALPLVMDLFANLVRSKS